MSETIWKKNVKEGFKITDANESAILNGVFGSPPEVLSQDVLPPPSFYDRLTNLSSNMNPTDAKNLYKDFITYAKTGADGIKDVIAGIISGISPNATGDDKGRLSRQVATWIVVVPASYWLVINWWYVLCYTNYTIDFRKFVWRPISWAMAPALNAFELFNYYTLTFRMDVDSKIPADLSRQLWNWRPVVFSLFHGIMVGSMFAFSVTDAAMNSMLNTGILYGVACVLSIYYFISLLMQDGWHTEFMEGGWATLMIFAGLLVISFIGMFVFITIVCPMFTMYLAFLSYFVLLAFNKFWPPSVISICNQIFEELKEAPVDDPIDKWGQIQNFAFQNAHSIYLLFIIFTILTIHINSAIKFSSNSLMVTAIIINIVLALIFAPSAFSVVFKLLNILLGEDAFKKEEQTIVPESNINT